MDKTRLKVQVERLSAQNSILEQRCCQLKAAPSRDQRAQGGVDAGRSFAGGANWRVCHTARTSCSRVLASSATLLLASCAYEAPGSGTCFGVTKMNVTDLRQSALVGAGFREPIRDMRHGPSGVSENLLMCASQDKTVKVLDMVSNGTVINYTLPRPCWSCEWNASNVNEVLCGSLAGEVAIFDLRKTGSCLKTLKLPGCNAPVHSLAQVHSGIVIGTVEGLWLYSDDGSLSKLGSELGGSCVSVVGTRNSSSRQTQVAASLRPKLGNPSNGEAAHAILAASGSGMPEPTSRLTGHSSRCVMSRASLWELGPDLCLASGDEDSNKVLVWNARTSEITQRLESHPSPVLSVHYFEDVSRQSFLASVSENELKVHKICD